VVSFEQHAEEPDVAVGSALPEVTCDWRQAFGVPSQLDWRGFGPGTDLSLSPDEHTAYFVAIIDPASNFDSGGFPFIQATKRSHLWSEFDDWSPLATTSVGSHQVCSPSFSVSADGLQLYLSNSAEDDCSSPSIYRATRDSADEQFGPYTHFPLLSGTDPWLSSDGQRLYLAAGDIYVVSNPSDPASRPALVRIDDSAAPLRRPLTQLTLSQDELSMYFLDGSSQAWQAHRASNSASFAAPLALLGARPRTWTSSDGCRAYDTFAGHVRVAQRLTTCSGVDGIDVSSDTANCGACSRNCAGAACVNGNCQAVELVSTSQPGLETSLPWLGTARDGNFYWPDRDGVLWGEGEGDYVGIGQKPNSGLALRVDGTAPLVVDDLNIYVPSSVGIWSVPRTGGDVTQLFCGAVGVLTQDQNDLFLVSGNDGELLRMSKRGGNPVMLNPAVLAGQIAVDSTDVYWANPSGIGMTSKDGGQTLNIVQNADTLSSFTLDADFVYWSESHTISRYAKASGAIQVLFYADQATALAVDEHFIYWTESNMVVKASKFGLEAPGSVRSFLLDGRPTRTTSILSDDHFLYLISDSDVRALVK
jgi:hypothetical protein